jgi:PAS domain S-box-containing protein
VIERIVTSSAEQVTGLSENQVVLERVLVLMPTRRDSERTAALLYTANLKTLVCSELAQLCGELRAGAGAVLITEESLLADTSGQLAETIRDQPAWSAVPVLLLAREGFAQQWQQLASDSLRNLIIVDRPVRTRTLLSVVLSALRARKHQYEIRDAIRAREQQASVLRAQEERLRFALSAGGLGSWDLDIDRDELSCSDICKAHFGREPHEQLTLQQWLDVVHVDDRTRVREALQTSVQTGSEYSVEHRVVWPSGETRWLMVRGRVAYGQSMLPSRLVGITLDVTDRERMHQALKSSELELARQAEQLRNADRRKDEFLATLAHELRNPLAPIRTGVELLRISSENPSSQHTLGIMSRQLSHMVRLIDDLLDVSRITRGKLELKRGLVNVGAIVDAAVESSRPAIDQGKHTLIVNVSERGMMLDADLTRLAQVISNLLNNSTRYTPPGGLIELSVRREGEFSVIAVSDNGLGIPEHQLEDVFEMFSQLDRAPESTRGGLGIGLALVRSLVEMHGGTVRAKSAGPGLGSTFTVRLPCAVSESAAGPEVVSSAESGSGKRILVVDDNEDAADLLALMLEQAGHSTRVAHDGPSALALVQAWPPDIAILDIGLPGMDGYEIARELRQKLHFPGLRLVALTGWGTTQDKHRAKEAGFDAHLTKPVNFQDLDQTLQDSIRR